MLLNSRKIWTTPLDENICFFKLRDIRMKMAFVCFVFVTSTASSPWPQCTEVVVSAEEECLHSMESRLQEVCHCKYDQAISCDPTINQSPLMRGEKYHHNLSWSWVKASRFSTQQEHSLPVPFWNITCFFIRDHQSITSTIHCPPSNLFFKVV